MTGKVIISITIPFLQPNEKFSAYKVALRHENSHALVNAAFRIQLDQSYKVITQPRVVYGGK
jgi:xanthine dehydrogenase iron-sulfur cluster and FAD-binding subunit A